MCNNTVTGTAYVTSGTISWTAEGQKGEYTATVGDASVLTPPEGATPEYKDGRLTGYDGYLRGCRRKYGYHDLHHHLR